MIYPRISANHPCRSEFILEQDITILKNDFEIKKLILEMEQKLNEIRGIRVHASLED